MSFKYKYDLSQNYLVQVKGESIYWAEESSNPVNFDNFFKYMCICIKNGGQPTHMLPLLSNSEFASVSWVAELINYSV